MAVGQVLRRLLTERARGRCEYCQTAQLIVVEMEVDHITPEAAGGATDPDNLCPTCVGCNGFKLAFQAGIDPQTGGRSRCSTRGTSVGTSTSAGARTARRSRA